MNRVKRQQHIGQLIVPLPIRDYCERHGDRLTVEQTAMVWDLMKHALSSWEGNG